MNLSVSLHSQGVLLDQTIKSPKSTLNLPFRISISEIEHIVNTAMNGVIYADSSFTDNNNDQLKLKVTKSGNIKMIPFSSNQFKIEAPIKVWAEKGVGALGYYTYKDCSFDMVLCFKTTFAMNKDWQVKTVTQPDGFIWKQKPVLKFEYVEIPITPIVGLIIKNNHASFAKIIDENSKSSMDFSTYGIQIWNMISQPMEVSPDYFTWLKITPHNIQMTPLKINGKYITANFGLDFTSETFVGKVPMAVKSVSKAPQLTLTHQCNDDFNITTAATITYPFIKQMAEKQMVGKKMEYLKGKYSIIITSIDIGFRGGKMLITSEIKGSTNGTLSIEAVPWYNSITHAVELKDLELDLKTRNIFQKSASWLFEGVIEKKMKEAMVVSVSDLENYTKQSLLESFNQEYQKGIKFSGVIDSLNPDQILTTDEGLVLTLLTKGKVSLLVEGMQ